MELNGSKLWDRVYFLTLLFVGLKLADEIGWSWWWVFSPVLITLAFGALMLFLAFLMGLALKRTPAYAEAQKRMRLMARAVNEEDKL